MKLRIRANTVRVRLTQSEVARLGAGERIEQETEFSPESKLVSSIEARAGSASASAEFRDGRVSIFLPPTRVREWSHSDEVSIEGSQPLSGNRTLQLLIEKDFACLHSQSEGIADAFPNPRSL